MKTKLLSLEQLKAKAHKEVFPHNPGTTQLLATNDGAFFLPKAKNSAQNHASENSLQLTTIEFDPEFESDDAAQATEKPKKKGNTESKAEPKAGKKVEAPAEMIDGLTKSDWAGLTVAEVGEQVKKIEDMDDLAKLLTWVDTKGGVEHIQARADELEAAAKNANPDLNHKTE